MKNLVLTFGILSVVLLQATALPGPPSSSELSEHVGNQDGQPSHAQDLYDLMGLTGDYDQLNTDTSDYDLSIPVQSRCVELLDKLTDKQKEIGMDLFVIALCEKNSDSDEPGKPSESVNRLLAELKKLSPEKLLPYVVGILKQWAYIIHGEYGAVPNREVCPDTLIQALDEWYSGKPNGGKDSRKTHGALDEYQRKSYLQFPNSQFEEIALPMSDDQFKVTWVDIFKTPDWELLQLSPYFLMVKHRKFLQLRHVYQYIWGVLPQDLLKGPDSVLEPVKESYPLYFRTDVNIFNAPVQELNSVWAMNFYLLISTMDTFFSLLVPLFHKDYDKLEKTLSLLMDASEPSTDKTKKKNALFLYSMAWAFPESVQDKVDQVLTGFLGEEAVENMIHLLFQKRQHEASQMFKHPSLKMLNDLVRVVNNGQVEVTMVDICSST
ncbi:hypothetical protein IWQ61_006446 [Dispira simplex]|nr:hypothetical protein IWQ61_006446 [Dispira simplex]